MRWPGKAGVFTSECVSLVLTMLPVKFAFFSPVKANIFILTNFIL